MTPKYPNEASAHVIDATIFQHIQWENIGGIWLKNLIFKEFCASIVCRIHLRPDAGHDVYCEGSKKTDVEAEIGIVHWCSKLPPLGIDKVLSDIMHQQVLLFEIIDDLQRVIVEEDNT